jgi:hypothetical protein
MTPLLQTTLATIKTTLSRPSADLAEARTSCPALAGYDTPAALVDAMRSMLGPRERDQLVAALVEEHQRAPRTVWQSILLAVFEPMLVRLRKRLGQPENEDRDQEVLVAFLEATREVRAGAYTTLALQWVTESKAFRAKKKERREQSHALYDDETYSRPLAAEANTKLAADEVARALEKRGGEELLRAVLATEVEEVPLVDYVARAYPRASASERATLYTRLRLAKAAVLGELRARAERTRPAALDVAA